MFGGGFSGPGAGPGTGNHGFGGALGGRAGGPGAGAGNLDQSLPFAGIPAELLAGVATLTAAEPDHDDPGVAFTHRPPRARPLTIARLVGRHRGLFAWACLAILAETVLLQAGPYLVQVGIDHGVIARDLPVLVVAAAAFGVTVLATGLASAARVRASGRLAAEVTRDLRVRVFAQLQRLSLSFYAEEKVGVILTRMISDVEALQQLLQDGLGQFVIQALTMLLVTVVLFAYNAELAVITLALVVSALIAASLWFRVASDRGYRRQRETIAAMYADLSESISGARVVTANNRQERNIKAHRRFVGRYRDANDYTGHINAIYGPGATTIGMLGLAALLSIGGRMVLRGELSVGELTAFVLYLNAFFQPVQQLVQLYTTYQQGRAAAVKLRDLLAMRPGVPERGDAVALPPIDGQITFEAVTFGYDPARPVLRAVDIDIAPGETVALVGPTGAGKSTVAKLITRFYDPGGGRVLIDGFDLREVSLSSLRQQIAVVPQEPFLFAGSIRDNVSFARPNATADEIWAAVDAVGLRELVERSPHGLDTVLHERGQSVSSGERQLLALARAFLAQPRVVVLDEATSSLDLESELRVEAALDVLLDGRTAVLIAHRLSTAMRADRILVVDAHGILESGSHNELLALGGRYAAMYETWSRSRSTSEGVA